MARWQPPTAQSAVGGGKSLTAAARQVFPSVRRPTPIPQTGISWQARAWDHYDSCGELRYGVNWYSNACASAEFYVARRMEDGTTERLQSGLEADSLEELFSAGDEEASMIKTFAQHHFVAGEWYLVARKNHPWEVASTLEYKQGSGDRAQLDRGDGEIIELTESDVVIRQWTPHPRQRNKADSPVRPNIAVLDEIALINSHIRAQIRSRLAGGGLLVLPSEISFPQTQGREDEDFASLLGEVMMEPIGNPDSAAAVVPIVIQAPGEYLATIQHLQFWSQLDENTVTLRNEAVRRLALGLDLPPEVFLGMGDVNHWSSWAIEESTIKSHIEPGLAQIADTLTTGFLRSIQQAAGAVDTEIVVEFDTSQLRLRPNRSREAIELWDRGELSGTRLRVETGFSDADKPTDEEREQWLLMKAAGGSTTPEQVEEAMRQLGANVQTSGEGKVREARPDRSLNDHPTNDPPDVPDGLAAACDIHVLRALERAGNRMKSKFSTRPPGITAADLYRFIQVPNGEIGAMLTDVWSHLPRTVRFYGYDPDIVEKCLDAYTRGLLISQREHTRDDMEAHLRRALA